MTNESQARDPIPLEIKLHKLSRLLLVSFEDGMTFEFSYEFLRVYSPSAEVKGHGPGQEILQIGKEEVVIDEIRAVGNYGISPQFSDGHGSGIYTWDYLYHLGIHYETLWEEYLSKLSLAGIQRKTTITN